MSLDALVAGVRERRSSALELVDPLPLAALPTPALILDRAALQRNIVRMARHVEAHGKGFRPHTKTHKCPIIAQMQLDAGAVGVCVAKASEAVAMVAAGVHEVLITSPVSTPVKAGIVADLVTASQGQLAIVVDSLTGVQVLEDALQRQADPAHTLNVLVDLDVAMGRTGVRDNATVLQIGAAIEASAHMRLRGFQHYAGHVMHIDGHAARAEASLALWSTVAERLADLHASGINYDIVTGCGTGTYDIDVAVADVTDLQVGSYVFMDEEYRRIGSKDDDRFTDFEVSLHIACTTISQPMDNAITVDAGFKSMASDTVPAAVDDLADTKFRFAGDEHGVLLSKTALQSVALGDVVRLVTPHCDPTVNLHDYYWVVEDDGLVHSAWPITGRGCNW